MDYDKLATKDDLKKLEQYVKAEFRGTKVDNKSLRQEILKVEERVENLEEGQKRLENKLDSLEGKFDKMINTLDGIAGAVDDLRTENSVGTHQIRELNLKTEDHEERIKRLKSPTTL